MSFGFANAQTVQDIPNTTPLKLDGAYTNITINHTLEEGEEPGSAVTHEKYKEGQAYYLSGFKSGDVAELCVKSTEESCYIIHFEVACKNDTPGSYGNFSLIDKNTQDIVWSVNHYDFAPIAKAWYGFSAGEIYVEDPIPAGEYIFSIEFQNENGGKSNTFNIGEFVFEAREEVRSYSLYTFVEPGDEAGSIVLNPSQNSYLEGTEIVATATPNTGYKFSHFENSYGDMIYENPYTLVITESEELVAYFDEVKMNNDVPGFIDWYTRLGSQGEIQTAGKDITVDGEKIADSGNVPYLGNYRNNNTESFELNVTEAGDYTMQLCYAVKDQPQAGIEFAIYDKAAYEEDSSSATAEWAYTAENLATTGQWTTFSTVEYPNVNLTEGRKILTMRFFELASTKYTVNVLKVGFGLGDNWGETDGIEDVIATDNAPVKAFNLQGIEVEPTAKGLIILSNGTKVYNK